MSDRVIEYTPSATLERFHASNAFVRLIRGPIGSGKSVGCCWEIYGRAMEQEPGTDGVRRSRWVITRNTYAELETTTLRTWCDWFGAAGRVVHGAPIAQTCRFEHDDGSRVELEVWFLALDRPEHVKKLLSLEITGAWMNEFREQPKAVLDALTGRVGRYPAKRDGGPTWFGVIGDTNPPDTDHWLFKLEEDQPEGFEFYAQPAGDGPDAENVENLPPGYYERLKAGKSEEWIKVYVKGDYGFVLDGKPVYPEFRTNLHVREFSIVKAWPLYGGLDFGLTPAGVAAQRAPNGQVRIHSELATEDMGLKRFARLWNEDMNARYPGMTWAAITGDPAGSARGDDERTSFDVLAGENLIARPAHTNSFTLRREAFAAPMGRLIDGEPGLLVHPQCKRLIKALAGGYHLKRVKTSGSERYHDEPDKNMHSHVAESGQYLVLGMGGGRELRRPTGPHVGEAPRFATRQARILD